MRIAVLIVALLVLTTGVHAQSVDVLFDFEELPPGPIDPPAVLTRGGLTIRISRVAQPYLPPMEAVDLSGFGAPFSYQTRALSPFLGSMWGTQLQVDIVSTPPGMGVEQISWEMGDFFPSDVDSYSTWSTTGTGEMLFHERGIDDLGFFPPFGSSIGFVQRDAAITQLLLRGGSPDFPNSLYYDNFVFTLTEVVPGTVQFAAGTDVPESDFGGDPFTSSFGGDGAAPVNTAPAVDAGGNLTVLSRDQGGTVLAGTAADADGDALTFRWLDADDVVVAGPEQVDADGACPFDLSTLPALPLGARVFTLEVTDGIATTVDVAVVTVENSPPVAAPSGGVVAEIGSLVQVGAEVADFDGNLLMYEWRSGIEVLEAGIAEPPQGGAAVVLTALELNTLDLGLGIHTLTLAVSDGINDEVTATAEIEVIDTTAPTMSATADKTILWPPNHAMVEVRIATNVRDNSGGGVTLDVEVLSSEPPEGDGDGNFLPDHQVVSVDEVTGVVLLDLRAERSGKGDGRTYRVRITATDASDNASLAEVEVLAPHGRGQQ